MTGEKNTTDDVIKVGQLAQDAAQRGDTATADGLQAVAELVTRPDLLAD